jgi:hypothetical protein
MCTLLHSDSRNHLLCVPVSSGWHHVYFGVSFLPGVLWPYRVGTNVQALVLQKPGAHPAQQFSHREVLLRSGFGNLSPGGLAAFWR